jgi:gliding motility-associated-like protein
MVVGYDTLNCFYDTGYVSMVVYPIPQFNIVEDQVTANTGSVVTLKTTNSPDITRWHWTPPFGLNCTVCPQPDMTVGKSVVYTARVSNDGGCMAQDKVTVTPVCTGENVFIPNTFSPNGDGQNDEFYPRGRGIALIKSMRLFNRWGELVYEMKDFAPNDRLKGWDGSYKGAPLTPDVYVYMVDVVCDNNVIFNLKGNVTLLR